MNLKTFTSNALCIASFFILTFVGFSQEKEFNIGFKSNPSFSISNISKQSDFDKHHFKVVNYRISLQIGLSASLLNKNWIFSYESFLTTKKTGLKFYNFSNVKTEFAQLEYSVLTWSNKLFCGYRIKNNSKPYYMVFIGPTFGYNLGGITSIHGNGSISLYFPDYYNEKDPNINSNIKIFSTGLSFKIRTEINKIGTIDYGLSLDYFFNPFPALEMSANIQNKQYYTRLVPNINTLSVDLIYIFKRKKSVNRTNFK